METSRLEWGDYFLTIAEAVKLRAACLRRQIGAVLVLDNRIVATGYNGAPRAETHCTDGGCPRGVLSYAEAAPLSAYIGVASCIAVHAEENALNQWIDGARNVRDIERATMYVTAKPCFGCHVKLRSWQPKVVYHTLQGDTMSYAPMLEPTKADWQNLPL